MLVITKNLAKNTYKTSCFLNKFSVIRECRWYKLRQISMPIFCDSKSTLIPTRYSGISHLRPEISFEYPVDICLGCLQYISRNK